LLTLRLDLLLRSPKIIDHEAKMMQACPMWVR
jgi:hypothetical protein